MSNDEILELIKPENKEEFLEKLKELLNANNAWLEQVKLTLLAVYSLERNFDKLNENYEFVLSECNKVLQDFLDKKAEYEKELLDKKAEFELLFERIKNESDDVFELVEEARELFENVVNTKNEIEVFSKEISEKFSKIEVMFKQISLVDEKIEKLDLLNNITKFEEMIKEFEKLSDEKQNQFKSVYDEIENLTREALKELDKKKKEAFDDLQNKHDNLLDSLSIDKEKESIKLIAIQNSSSILKLMTLYKGGKNG